MMCDVTTKRASARLFISFCVQLQQNLSFSDNVVSVVSELDISRRVHDDRFCVYCVVQFDACAVADLTLDIRSDGAETSIRTDRSCPAEYHP